MIAYPTEALDLHTRLLKCGLETETCAIYWRRVEPGQHVDPNEVLHGYWFGDKRLDRIKVLLTNLRARFDAFPRALQALHTWQPTAPGDRAVVGHVHLALSDPLYRAFVDVYLPARRGSLRAEVDLAGVTDWVGSQGPGRWTMATRRQFASKLLGAAREVGLVTGRRDPRGLSIPRVSDDALTYTLYLLRHLAFDGTLFDNPYLRSLGLEPGFLRPRLARLPDLAVRGLGDVMEVDWAFDDVAGWARARHGEAT